MVEQIYLYKQIWWRNNICTITILAILVEVNYLFKKLLTNWDEQIINKFFCDICKTKIFGWMQKYFYSKISVHWVAKIFLQQNIGKLGVKNIFTTKYRYIGWQKYF